MRTEQTQSQQLWSHAAASKQEKKQSGRRRIYMQTAGMKAESVMHDRKQAGLEAGGSMEDKLAVMTTRPSTWPGLRGTVRPSSSTKGFSPMSLMKLLMNTSNPEHTCTANSSLTQHTCHCLLCASSKCSLLVQSLQTQHNQLGLGWKSATWAGIQHCCQMAMCTSQYTHSDANDSSNDDDDDSDNHNDGISYNDSIDDNWSAGLAKRHQVHVMQVHIWYIRAGVVDSLRAVGTHFSSGTGVTW